VLDKVGGDELLVQVLAAAEEEDVDTIDVDWTAPHLHDLELDATVRGPVLEGKDVAAVAVDAHLARVQLGQPQPLPDGRHDACQN